MTPDKITFPLSPDAVYTFTGKELQELLDDYSIRVATDATARALTAYGDQTKMIDAIMKATKRQN